VYHYWTPSNLLYNLEWWELLGTWNTVLKWLNDRADDLKNVKHLSRQKENVKTAPVSKYVNTGKTLSPYAKEMREKILRGEY
jgi:hypothetical protein